MSKKTVDAAIAAFAEGDFVLVVSDDAAGGGGALMFAAERVDPDKIAFMMRVTGGLICVPMEGRRLDELGLPLMAGEVADTHRAAFSVSVDAAPGTSAAMSAVGRATTIARLIDPSTRPTDLVRPGHVFPLRYQPGGLLVSPSHSEAAIDLARMAGAQLAAVISEVLNPDGTIARKPQIEALAERYEVPLLRIGELIDHRWRSEAVMTHVVEAELPTAYGTFRAHGYRSNVDGSEHIALVYGSVSGRTGVLARVHSECVTGDVFGSVRCDCGQQLDESMRLIAGAGHGIIVYDRSHEGRGIGLLQKLRAYGLQDEGLDTVEANLTLGHPVDARHYGTDAQILSDLKVDSIRLLTNNPDKIDQLVRLGVDVLGRVPLEVGASTHNAGYLNAKAEKMGHYLNGNAEAEAE